MTKKEEDGDSDEAASSAEHTDDDDASLSDPTLKREAQNSQSTPVQAEGDDNKAASGNDGKEDIAGEGNAVEDYSNGDRQLSGVESVAFAGGISHSMDQKIDT